MNNLRQRFRDGFASISQPLQVAIITNAIPTYRVDLYERLAGLDTFRTTVFHQSDLPGSNMQSANISGKIDAVRMRHFSLKGETASWQRLPVLTLWRKFDLLIFSGNPRVISTVLWATLFRIVGKKVVIWGQLHTANASNRTERIRLLWWRVFRYFLAYTDHEAAILKQRGFSNRIVVGMNNGLNQNEIDAERARWSKNRLEQWTKERELQHHTIVLSCARLEKKNRLDLLIQCLPQLIERHHNLLWCVIGDGAEEPALRKLAGMLGVDTSIRWLGASYREAELAPWFIMSRCAIHPGAIGLSLLHAFGYGVPVITHDNPHNQMPEIAALEHGVNGLLFREKSVDDLFSAVDALLTDNASAGRMREAALRVAQKQYNTEVMTSRFGKIIALAASDQSP